MAGAEASRRGRSAWWLLLAIPVAGAQTQPVPTTPPPTTLPEAGLLEFLAEEPALGDDVNDALVKDDAGPAPARKAGQDEVKDDDAHP